MAGKKAAGLATVPLPPRICKAVRGSWGRVIRGVEIVESEAVAERKAGRDIVVGGGPTKAKRMLAHRIELTVGPCKRQDPHEWEGPYALPHYQPEPRPPAGHSFYETDGIKAAKNP